MEFVILEFMKAHHIPAFWKLWALADTVLEVMNFGGYGFGVFDGSPAAPPSSRSRTSRRCARGAHKLAQRPVHPILNMEPPEAS